MEKCYANNTDSLFRKYAHLVTWFARTSLGRAYLGVPKDVSLMLPNGYHQENQATFFTRSVFSKKLSPTLAKIDLVGQWIKDFSEAKQLLAFELGMTRNMPAIARSMMFLTGGPYNPDADPESTTVDGRVYLVPGADPATLWADLRGGNGDGFTDNVASVSLGFRSSATSERWWYLQRHIYMFDTSSLPSAAAISAGTFSLVGISGSHDDFAMSVGLTEGTAASDTGLANSDFEANVGYTTRFATDILGSNLSVDDSTYNDWTLNAGGRDFVKPDAITRFGIKWDADIDNTAPTWASDAIDNHEFENAEEAGVKIPKLLVTYTAGTQGAMRGNKYWGETL